MIAAAAAGAASTAHGSDGHSEGKTVVTATIRRPEHVMEGVIIRRRSAGTAPVCADVRHGCVVLTRHSDGEPWHVTNAPALSATPDAVSVVVAAVVVLN